MENINNSLGSQIGRMDYFPILYELLPPPAATSAKDKGSFFQVIDKVLGNVHVEAVNIPEVREESGRAKEKAVATFRREDPRFFAKELLDHLKIPVIINHVVVHDSTQGFH